MRVKYWAIAVVLLLAVCRPARAAGSFPTLTAAGFQTLAAGLGAQVEMRHAKVPAMDAVRLLASAPGGSWQPLLQVAAPWSAHYAGIFLKSSSGRLSLMIATLASRQATLVELRLSVRQLLDGLRSVSLITDYAAETAEGED
jgi:hypothetical protein